MQFIAATAFGFRDPGAGPTLANMPYVVEQGVGAFVGLALYTLWLARLHLAETWRKAFRGDASLDDTQEPMSYRAAYLGLFASFLLLVGFGVALGLSPGVSLLFFGLFFLSALAMSRIRAEAGLPWGPGGSGGWTGAHTVIVNFGGSRSLTPQELTAFAFTRWNDADLRCLTQPAEIEAMKNCRLNRAPPDEPASSDTGPFRRNSGRVLCFLGFVSRHLLPFRGGQRHHERMADRPGALRV